MSCLDCEYQQKRHFGGGIFYKWKDTIIEVKACSKHSKEVFKALDKAQGRYHNTDKGWEEKVAEAAFVDRSKDAIR